MCTSKLLLCVTILGVNRVEFCAFVGTYSLGNFLYLCVVLLCSEVTTWVPKMADTELYDRLNVSRNASDSEIKRVSCEDKWLVAVLCHIVLIN